MPSVIIEVATGPVDGVNTTFYTSAMYVPGSLQVWLNGQMKRADLQDGWVEQGADKFKLNEAPVAGSVVQVYFRPL